MLNKRQVKLSKQLKKDLGEILQKDFNHYFGSALVSILSIAITPDLKQAKVYFSIYPTHEIDRVLEKLEEHKSQIRFFLGKRIKNSVRNIPELFFYKDQTLENSAQIDSILSNLNIPPETSE